MSRYTVVTAGRTGPGADQSRSVAPIGVGAAMKGSPTPARALASAGDVGHRKENKGSERCAGATLSLDKFGKLERLAGLCELRRIPSARHQDGHASEREGTSAPKGNHPPHSLPTAYRQPSFLRSTSPPERKATRELLKPGGLSGELPAETPVPFTLWRG